MDRTPISPMPIPPRPVPWRRWLFLAVAYVAAAVGVVWLFRNLTAPDANRPSELQGKTPPDFPASGTWINADKPLDLASLRGKAVFVHFTFIG